LAGGTQSQTYWLRFFGYDDEYDNFWAGSTFNVYGDAKAGAVQFKKFSGDAAELTVNHPGAGEGKNTVKPTISYGS
jgi:hypothetical protein